MSNRNERAQARAVQAKLGEMHEWYILESGGKMPDGIRKDTKSYRGIRMYWYEPILPGVTNPVLIEEALGDSWSLRLEPFEPKPLAT